MGKNLYETPRDMNKWHTQKNGHIKSQQNPHSNDKKAHLEDLKKRYQKKKK